MKILTLNSTVVRKANEDLFKLTSILDGEQKKHHPYIVLDKEDNCVTVTNYLSDLLRYPDDTEVLWQWQGQWRSDFFVVTVGELKQQLEAREKTI